MLDRSRGWTGRYLITNQSPFRRHQSRKDQIHTFRNKDGLAITIDEFLPDSGATRLEKPTTSTRSNLGWLSAFTLLFTALLFFLLGVALLLVWHYNTTRNGFALVTNNHYSWTYGPTALLVLVVAVWRQLDYHFKAAAPWTVLHRGHASGKDSLLLDYVSPLQPVSLWRALTNRHFGVLVTITGFVLLKIITLASTGLFVEDLTEFTGQSVNLNRTIKFNGSLWNTTQPFATEDASIAYAAYGVLARGVAVQEQGTTDNLVYETVDLSPQLRNRSTRMQTQLNAFLPNFNCRNATVSINPSPYGSNGEQSSDTIAILSPSCQLKGGAQPIFVLNAASEICPKTQFRGNMISVNCSDSSSDPADWQLLTLAKVGYEQVLNGSVTTSVPGVDNPDLDIVSWEVRIKQVTSVLCRPSYTMGKVNVSYDLRESPPLITTASPLDSSEKLEGFDNGDLASRFTSALVAGANMFGDLSAESDLEEDFPNTMFKMMASSLSSGGQYQALMGTSVLQVAAEKTFRQIAVQFADKYLVEKHASEISGTAILVANRLKVAALSFWIMLGGFALMTMFAFGAFLLRPRSELPSDYRTIWGAATILGQNSGFNSLIGTFLRLKETEVARRISEYGFSAFASTHSDDSSSFNVEGFLRGNPQHASNPSPHDDAPEHNRTAWWHPIPIRRPVVVLVLLLLGSTIAVLQVLQQYSDKGNGILEVPGMDSIATTVYTRLLPALTILILATSVNAIDFNIMVLAPYNLLHSGEVSAEKSLRSSLVDKLPPVGLYKALRHRHYAAFCSSTAAIVGSVLTVIVSGLYSPVPFPGIVTALSLSSNDTFNTSWPGSATYDGTAVLIVSLTESLKTSFPAFTYDELAFPSLVPPDISGNTTGLQLQADLPALRASLNCTALDSRFFNVTVGYDPRIETASASIDASMPLPSSCLLGGPGGNLSYIDVNYRAGFQTNASYFGKVLDLHVGPYDAIQGSPFGESNPGAQADNPPGCPSLAFIYGYADVDRPTQNDVTVLMCYQGMQSLQTTVVFDLASMSLSTASPPFPVTSDVEVLPSGSHGETAFSYRIQQHMDQSLSMFNQTEFASANLAEAPVDNFFQAVLFGRKPLLISTLVGVENSATMLAGINAFYRRYMAQAISSSMRVPVNPDDATTAATRPQSYTGKVLSSSQTVRLVQHNGAKLALQILIGIMALLTALACYLTKLDGLVPYNPCTIFGVAALVAGSRMCDAGGFETLRDGGSDGKYTLGWWEEDDPGREAPGLDGIQPRKRRRYGIDAVEQHR